MVPVQFFLRGLNLDRVGTHAHHLMSSTTFRGGLADHTVAAAPQTTVVQRVMSPRPR